MQYVKVRDSVRTLLISSCQELTASSRFNTHSWTFPRFSSSLCSKPYINCLGRLTSLLHHRRPCCMIHYIASCFTYQVLLSFRDLNLLKPFRWLIGIVLIVRRSYMQRLYTQNLGFDFLLLSWKSKITIKLSVILESLIERWRTK